MTLSSPSNTRRLIEELARGGVPSPDPPGVHDLTPHEFRVVPKLNLRHRIQAVVLCCETGLVASPPLPSMHPTGEDDHAKPSPQTSLPALPTPGCGSRRPLAAVGAEDSFVEEPAQTVEKTLLEPAFFPPQAFNPTVPPSGVGHPNSTVCEDYPVTEGGHRERALEPEDLGRLFLERANQCDVAGVVALYEPDAVLASPDGTSASRAAAIRSFYERLLTDRPEFLGEVQPALRSGDLALTSTRFSGGATAEVARRQPDGSWLRLLISRMLSGRQLAKLA